MSRKPTPLRIFLAKILGFTLIYLLILGPVAYKVRGWDLLFSVILVALVLGQIAFKSSQFAPTFASGVTVGILFVPVAVFRLVFRGEEILVIPFMLFVSVFLVAFLNLDQEILNSLKSARARVIAFVTLAFAVATIFSVSLPVKLPLAILLGVAYPCFVIPLGVYLGKKSRHILVVFDELWPYFRVMGIPLFAFAFGYFLLTSLFASYFWVAYSCDPSYPDCSIKGLPQNPMFGDFIYFSTITIATVGYGDVTPNSSVTKALANAEAILGVGWITVGFAAVIAYLQPRFNEIAQQQQKDRGESSQ